MTYACVFSVVFFLAAALPFARPARAASRPDGATGDQDGRCDPSGTAETRSQAETDPAGTGDGPCIDWCLFLLDDDSIAALEREMNACTWPPDAQAMIPPTDH